MNTARIEALRRYFETLTRDSLATLDEHYANDAYFKDPFNEVRGVNEIEKVFRHMFETLDSPQFVIQDVWTNAGGAVLLWEFRFSFRGKEPATQQSFSGMSLLRFDSHGKVMQHRDYWDAAEEIYEKFPLIGPTLRWVKKRMR